MTSPTPALTTLPSLIPKCWLLTSRSWKQELHDNDEDAPALAAPQQMLLPAEPATHARCSSAKARRPPRIYWAMPFCSCWSHTTLMHTSPSDNELTHSKLAHEPISHLITQCLPRVHKGESWTILAHPRFHRSPANCPGYGRLSSVAFPPKFYTTKLDHNHRRRWRQRYTQVQAAPHIHSRGKTIKPRAQKKATHCTVHSPCAKNRPRSRTLDSVGAQHLVGWSVSISTFFICAPHVVDASSLPISATYSSASSMAINKTVTWSRLHDIIQTLWLRSADCLTTAFPETGKNTSRIQWTALHLWLDLSLRPTHGHNQLSSGRPLTTSKDNPPNLIATSKIVQPSNCKLLLHVAELLQ